MASYTIGSIILPPVATPSAMLAVALAPITLYLILALLSLVVIYLRHAWEYDADLHAPGKMGMITFTKALVKAYIASHSTSAARYVSSASLSVEFKLGGVPPLTWCDTIIELLYRTLSLRGLIDFISIATKPLGGNHLPLYLRLRAILTVL